MVGVVDSPVAVVISEAWTHFDVIIGGDGDIPLVKEGVDIPPEEHSVGDLVALLDAEGDDVGSLEDRQGPLFADGAATVIGVGDTSPAKPPVQCGREPWSSRIEQQDPQKPPPVGRGIRSITHQEDASFMSRLIIALALDDVELPVCGDGDPILTGKRSREDDTPDLRIGVVRFVLPYALLKFSKHGPFFGPKASQARKVGRIEKRVKNPHSNDVVLRGVELERKTHLSQAP